MIPPTELRKLLEAVHTRRESVDTALAQLYTLADQAQTISRAAAEHAKPRKDPSHAEDAPMSPGHAEATHTAHTTDPDIDIDTDIDCENLGFARVDHQRTWRKGFPEAIFAQGKTPAQIAGIAQAIMRRSARCLITRLALEAHEGLCLLWSAARQGHYNACARTLSLGDPPRPALGDLLVLCAGTADLPVAEEVVETARIMGNRVERIADVGVAGLHRLLAHGERIRAARVVVVVAGMEGALPSVVGGLTAAPLIAVPTSIGYGTGMGGFSALLSMLNSCAPGIGVTNIDNGFGAAYLASLINLLPAAQASHASSPP